VFSDLIGKPFRDMGRGPDAYDCWGLCLEVNRRVGRTVPDYDDLLAPDDITGICGEYSRRRIEWEPTDHPSAGDVVVIRRFGGGYHFGVMVSETHFAHTSRGSGVRIESIDHPIRKQLIKEIGRCRISTP
jgi:cell wall-associated NlpC family hydrolase